MNSLELREPVATRKALEKLVQKSSLFLLFDINQDTFKENVPKLRPNEAASFLFGVSRGIAGLAYYFDDRWYAKIDSINSSAGKYGLSIDDEFKVKELESEKNLIYGRGIRVANNIYEISQLLSNISKDHRSELDYRKYNKNLLKFKGTNMRLGEKVGIQNTVLLAHVLHSSGAGYIVHAAENMGNFSEKLSLKYMEIGANLMGTAHVLTFLDELNIKREKRNIQILHKSYKPEYRVKVEFYDAPES